MDCRHLKQHLYEFQYVADPLTYLPRVKRSVLHVMSQFNRNIHGEQNIFSFNGRRTATVKNLLAVEPAFILQTLKV